MSGLAPPAGWEPGQPVALDRVVGDSRYVDATAIGVGRRGPTVNAPRRLDGAEVAVKVAACPAEGAEIKAFPAAAMAAAAVRSPNLVPLLDHGVSRQGEPWSVTPWYPLGSVARRLAEAAWSVDDVVRVARQAATGLAALHGAGLVHGNVTPGNLLYAESGEIAADGCALPGLAPRLAPGEAATYLAPEVVGAGSYSLSSDLWSLGACVFAMLRGRPPWADAAGGGAVGFMLAVSTKPPAPARRADVPAWLDDLLTACLAVDPADRPASAEDVLDRLIWAGRASRAATSVGLPPAEGRPLGSSYVLVEPIGSGTTGQVWRGERRGDRLAVAVKLLRPELSSEPEAVARFLRERTSLVGLTHPNLVSVLDMVAEGSTLGIVMDLVTGRDLRKILAERDSVPPVQALRLISQVATGVQAMRDAGLVHRDLKPENVLVEHGSVARVTDFGLARALNGTVLTRTEQLVGTAEYLAPELVAGRPLTPAADVYSLGVLSYEMIAGHRPFDSEHPAAVLRSHLDTSPARPPDWPDPLWYLVEMMLAKDPAARPSAGDIATYARQLAEWFEGAAYTPPHQIAAPPPPLHPPSAPSPGLPEPQGSDQEPALLPVSPPASSEAETSVSLSPLPEAPPSPPDPAATIRRGRRGRLIVGLIAVLVLAAGGGVGAALATRGGKPTVTTLRPYDVTTSVTVAANGEVTVRWTPLSASTFVIAVSDGPVAERTPVGVPDSMAGFYRVTGTPQGLHCFFAEAYFTGSPPQGLKQTTDVEKQCKTVP